MYEFINLTAFRAGWSPRPSAAQAGLPRAVGVRPGAGADPADGVGQMAVHQRRAGDACIAELLVADPRLGGQPRFRSVLVAGVASILFLLKMSPLARPQIATARLLRVLQRLPDAQTLDRIAYRTTIFALPIFGGVISAPSGPRRPGAATGAGTRRRRSPSSPGGLRGRTCTRGRPRAGVTRKAAQSTSSASVAMVFNLFFINLVTVGLHLRRSGLNPTSDCCRDGWRRQRNSGSSWGPITRLPAVVGVVPGRRATRQAARANTRDDQQIHHDNLP